MAGVWCPRCLCNVRLEQDGKSCSNCGRVLVIPAPAPPPPRKRAPRTRKRVRRPTTSPTALTPPAATPNQGT